MLHVTTFQFISVSFVFHTREMPTKTSNVYFVKPLTNFETAHKMNIPYFGKKSSGCEFISQTLTKDDVNKQKRQIMVYTSSFWIMANDPKNCNDCLVLIIAGSLEAAYSLDCGAREIWGKGGGETLALL